MKYLDLPTLTTLAFVSSFVALTSPSLAANSSDRPLNLDGAVVGITTGRDILAQFNLDLGGGVNYVSSRAVAENKVEVIWEYQGTRYTFQSTVGSYFIQNEGESRQARGGERDALRTAYDEYKRSGGYHPVTSTPSRGGVNYISSRPITDIVEIIWDDKGNRYTFQSQVDSYYITNKTESRQARRSEREALRIAYDNYKQSGNNPSDANNGLLQARAAYNTSLVDRNANTVNGISRGDLIFVKCSDIQRIGGDKRVFARDRAGNQGYIPTNAVNGASCNW